MTHQAPNPSPEPPDAARDRADGSNAQRPNNSLAGVVGAGMTWVMLFTFVSKAGAFVQVFFIGKFLAEREIGLASLAASIAALVTWIRDAGVRDLLIQRGDAEYQRLEGSAFWLASLVNALGFALLCGLAFLLPLIAEGNAGLLSDAIRYLGQGGAQAPEQWSDPALTNLLIAWGIWLPIQTVSSLLIARLQMLLRFGNTSAIWTGSSLLRSTLTIIFAWMGWGPLSLVAPMIITSTVEGVWAFWLLRDRIWSGAPAFSRWPGIIANTKWLMFGVLATNLFDWAGILASGMRVDAEVLGRYSFARLIPMQIYIILSFNLRLVLFPTMSRIKDDPGRLRDATLRALRVQMLLAAPTCVGLGLVCGPLIRAVWRDGKWDEAAPAAIILCVFFAFRTTFGLTSSVLTAAGKFRAWACLTMLEGLGLGAAAWIGTSFGERARYIAAAVGVYLLISRLLMIVYSARVVGLAPSRALLAVLPPWLWSLVVAAGTTVLAKWATDRLGHVGDVIALGATFALLFIYGTRMLMPFRLNELVQVFPGRMRTIARSLLRLPEIS